MNAGIARYKLLFKTKSFPLELEIHISDISVSERFDGPGRKVIYLVDGKPVDRLDFLAIVETLK